MILETVLASLVPVAVDGVRGAINMFTGGAGAKPSNPDDVIKLMDAETRKLQALAQIDAVGNVSQWVANLRALQRPVVSFLIINGYILSVFTLKDVVLIDQMATYAQMVTFYLFGDRTYMYFKKGK